MRASVGWDEDPVVAGWPGLAPLPGDRVADACVVGLGASGLAAVAALADRGLQIVGVDTGRIAAGASGGNGGFLLGGGAPFLHDAIERWGAAAAVALYRETLAELDRLDGELGADVIRRVGSIRLAGLPGAAASEAEATDRAAELADCAAHEAALRAYGIAVQRYDGPLGSGLYLPGDAATNPARRALESARRLSARAALYEHTPVTGIAPGRVSTGRGTISAAVVIVAADGRLDVLLPQLAGQVRTARLQMVCTEPVHTGRLSCLVYGRWGFDYAQQHPDGRLFVGGGRDRAGAAEWTPDPAPTRAVQAYLDALAGRIAGEQVMPRHRWGASVGYTADGRALCVEAAPGVVAVGGYSGTGNLVGPVAARAAVALAVEGIHPPSYLASTRPLAT